MAITDKDAVLILGAGTSVPFGMPTGMSLISQIHSQLSSEIKQTWNQGSMIQPNFISRFSYPANDTAENFQRFPLVSSMAYDYYRENSEGLEGPSDASHLEKPFKDTVHSFAMLLDDQTSDTIDDFIVQNPSASRFAKISACVMMMKSLYRVLIKQNSCLELRSLALRQLPIPSNNEESARNWVHLLINIVRQAVNNSFGGTGGRLKIVTFNYDPILEYVLDVQFSNSELSTDLDWRDFITIHHVHGKFPDLKTSVYKPFETCSTWADAMHVVQESEIDNAVDSARKQARNLISHAKEIYACGFAFSGPNCRLLGLGEPANSEGYRTIHYCNFDGNVGLARLVGKYEREPIIEKGKAHGGRWTQPKIGTKVVPSAGTKDNPMSVEDWFYAGAVGEPPA